MKDILVHMDDSERCYARLEIAIGLAKRFEARLTGLFARSESHTPSAMARRASEGLVRAAELARVSFDEAVKAAGVDARWFQLSHGETSYVVNETLFCARYASLVVMGQYDPKGSPVPEELTEQVVLNCGRPVLVVPNTGSFPTVGERVVVAWNASREATRALHDSLPLMHSARAVTILSMRGPDEHPVADAMDLPQVDVLDHVRRLGIDAQGERLAGGDIGKMDLLLSRVCDLGADLLVMGAHGHYGGLAKLRGSGTRYVLRHMTLPVLMSH